MGEVRVEISRHHSDVRLVLVSADPGNSVVLGGDLAPGLVTALLNVCSGKTYSHIASTQNICNGLPSPKSTYSVHIVQAS